MLKKFLWTDFRATLHSPPPPSFLLWNCCTKQFKGMDARTKCCRPFVFQDAKFSITWWQGWVAKQPFLHKLKVLSFHKNVLQRLFNMSSLVCDVLQRKPRRWRESHRSVPRLPFPWAARTAFWEAIIERCNGQTSWNETQDNATGIKNSRQYKLPSFCVCFLWLSCSFIYCVYFYLQLQKRGVEK